MAQVRWRDKSLDPDRALDAMLDPWLVADLTLPMLPTRQGYLSFHLTGDSHGTLTSICFHSVFGFQSEVLQDCTDQTLAALRLSYMIILLLPAPLWDSWSSHNCDSLHLLCCTVCFMAHSGWHEDVTQLGQPSLFSWRSIAPSEISELVKF